jgi:hypothetical protein
LNRPDIGTGFQQVNRETVPKQMRRYRFGDTGTSARLLAGLLDGIFADVLASVVARKEPRLRPFHAPPRTQDFQ